MRLSGAGEYSMAHSLTLSRELFVPRDLVYQVWTEVDHLSGWYSPSAGCTREISADVRVGGRYLFAWTTPDGTRFAQSGEYRAVDPPAEFRCSQWYQEGFDGTFGTQLTVALAEVAGSTRIDIQQQGFPTEISRDSARQLWSDLLDQLEGYFSVI